MRMPWRRPSVPVGVREALHTKPEERVLTTAKSGDEDFVVATTVSLYLVVAQSSPTDGSFSIAWRIRWDQIDKARWEPPHLMMQLQSPLVDGGTDSVEVLVDQVSDLPATVRDRVNSSIIASEEIPVLSGSARVVARRNSDTGEAVWRVIFGPGIDSQDPEVRQTVEEGLAAIRSRLGV